MTEGAGLGDSELEGAEEGGPDDTGPGPDQADAIGSRRIHGGMPLRPDDEAHEAKVEQERGAIAERPYDLDDVPPAVDGEVEIDLTQTPAYQEELAEVRRQRERGELLTEGSGEVFPPTRYEDN